MIEKTYLVSQENEYKKYNHFEISDGLKDILDDEYYLYDSNEFKKENEIVKLYKKNFEDKYDREKHKEIYDLYINNESFRKKAYFVYSIIDYERYVKFVQENPELENADELMIKYSILDSDGVKVQIYHISIIDITFVF